MEVEGGGMELTVRAPPELLQLRSYSWGLWHTAACERTQGEHGW